MEDLKEGTAPMPIYTEEDMNVREDLLEKLLTLEHVRSILVVRDESPVYLNQIASLQRIVQGWYTNDVSKKKPAAPAPATPPAEPGNDGGE